MKRLLIIILSLFLAAALSGCAETLKLEIPELEIPPIDELFKLKESPDAEPTEPADIAQPTAPAEEDLPPALAAPQINEEDIASLATLQGAYEGIYEKVLPSVVSITTTRTIAPGASGIPEMPFGFEFGQPETPQEYNQYGAGSGFVWDTQGHIVTNNHVIEDADIIRVRFANGASARAELVGTDPTNDLAVLKVALPTSQLKPVTLSDSTALKVGQIAIAIGNPWQLDGSMTTGIISALGRSYSIGDTDGSGLSFTIPDVIQTDAAINPGNSGGVLVDIQGELIGVTFAIESTVRANAGVGYAIPAVIIQKVVPVLIDQGVYVHPWIGISGGTLYPELAELMDLPASQRGALVNTVTPDSPAEEAGLIGSSRQAQVDGVDVTVGGDVITAVDGQPIEDFEDLVAFLARYTEVGQTITLTVLRDGKTIELDLTLRARPGSPSAATRPQQTTGAWLGVSGLDMTRDIAEAMDLKATQKGVLIQQVTAGSPADEAGLRGSYKPATLNGESVLVGGDVVTAVDGTAVTTMQELATAIGRYEPGAEVTLTLLRDGKETSVKVTLVEKPE